MKKILVVIVVFICSIDVVSADYICRENIQSFSSYFGLRNENNDDFTYHDFLYFSTCDDVVPIYSLAPYINSYSYLSYTPILRDQANKINVSQEEWDRLEKIIYYGYGYGTHTSSEYRNITSYMIWREFYDNKEDIRLITNIFKPEIDGYVDEINEIESLIKGEIPSFGNELILNKTKSIEIEDKNNIINGYSIQNSDNLNLEIKDNKLIIKDASVGEYNIVLQKGEYKPFTLLYLNDNQSYIKRDGNISNTINIKIKIESGKLKIVRNKDDSFKNNIPLNATYNIIKDNNIIDSVVLDDDGIGYINSIEPGVYSLKEQLSINEYQRDNEVYKFVIESGKTTMVNTYPKLKYKEVIINNFYQSDDLTGSISLSILNEGIEILDIKQDENIPIKIVLPYGTYTIRENNNFDNYEIVNEFEFEVNDKSDDNIEIYNNKVLNNDKLLVKNPKTNDYIKSIFLLLFSSIFAIIFILLLKKRIFCQNKKGN